MNRYRLLSLSALLSVAAVSAAWAQDPSTPSKKKTTKQEQRQLERLAKLEQTLLTPPNTPQEETELLAAWRQYLDLSVAFQAKRVSPRQPGLDSTLVGLAIKNRSPCRIHVVSDDKLQHLQVNGHDRAGAEWVAEPNRTLLLAVSKKLP